MPNDISNKLQELCALDFIQREPGYMYWFDLINTDFQFYVLENQKNIWYYIPKKNIWYYIPSGQQINFEKVLEQVPSSVKECLLFHLDLLI